MPQRPAVTGAGAVDRRPPPPNPVWPPLQSRALHLLHVQQVSERGAERLVEDGVDDGVKGAVEVAEPEKQLEYCAVHLAARAESHGEVSDEEGRPAEHKQGEHGAEHLHSFTFCLHRV